MLRKIKMGALLAACAVVLSSELVVGQTVPDAGSIRRDIEQAKEPPPPKIPKPVIQPPPKPTSVQPGKASVIVNNFQFSGNTLIETAELEKAVAGYLNRPLTFADLEAAAARVAEVYRQAGWVARPALPPQDISSGQVKINLVEATFGVARINGDAPQRVSTRRLLAIIKSEQPKGQFINADALDNALRRMNELPGIAVNGILKAGERSGETDLILNVDEKPVASGSVMLDNAGSKFTGEERLVVSGVLDSLFGYGERFNTTLLYSEGATFGQLGVSLPVGISGWRVGSHASTLEYSLDKDFGNLGIEGSSTEFGVDANYSLMRLPNKNVSLAFAYDNTTFENSNSISSSSEYSVRGLSATLSGQYLDHGDGVNQAVLTLINGTVDDKTDNLSESLGERFSKIHYVINRQHRLSERFSLYGAFSGQWADSNLTSSEKFTLGGPSGVRAYRASEGSGDEGQMLNLEVRMRLPLNISVAAFYDLGSITVAKKPVASTTPTIDHYDLSGAGLSARWQASFGLNLKATWATPLGSNKGVSTGAEDDEDMVWLQAGMPF